MELLIKMSYEIYFVMYTRILTSKNTFKLKNSLNLFHINNRNMIERYVTDEFSASDKNLSNGKSTSVDQ
jgi:hypothetical protein